MKLKDWADKQGISYITAWRWYKAQDPRLVNAYQSDSGTIIVPDESDASEQTMGNVQSNDVMSIVLKKTVELSKNNGSVEDFAAWILSNFSLRPNSQLEGPKYSRVKPKPEAVQEHFKQFLKPKGEKPKPNMFVATNEEALEDLVAKSDDLTTKELVDEIHKIGADAGAPVNPADAPEVGELIKDLSFALSTPNLDSINVTNYEDFTDGVVTRSIDSTPQPIYTGSSGLTVSTGSTIVGGSLSQSANCSTFYAASNTPVASTLAVSTQGYGAAQPSILNSFHPTAKEMATAARISSIVPDERPRRGRKSLKNKESK